MHSQVDVLTKIASDQTVADKNDLWSDDRAFKTQC